MAEAATAERKPATPEEIWEILRETASRQKEHEEYWAELRKERKEEAAREAVRREAEAVRQEAEAKREAVRREEEAAREAAWREAEAARREEEAVWREEEAARRAEEAARRKEEAAQRAEDHKRWEERFEREKAKMDGLMAETDRRIDRVTKNVGGINRSLGELVETLIAARLWEKFSAYPYNLKRAYQRIPVYNEKNETLTDIDILLVDGEWAMAVEVKREASDFGEVEHHVKRMGRIRKYPPAEVVGKKLLGAIAGGVVSSDVRKKAHAAGFFVLELKGEAVDLVPPPDGFVPSEW